MITKSAGLVAVPPGMVTETRPVTAGGDRYDREIAAADPDFTNVPAKRGRA